MITVTLVDSSEISEELLNRLFEEAFPFTSEERQRLGADKLKEELFNLADSPVVLYKENDYIVGMASVFFPYPLSDGKKYLQYRHPIYGCNEAGSRAWWYTEEQQEAFSNLIKSLELEGLIVVMNPKSPAAQATLRHMGYFGKHLSSPREVTEEYANMKLRPDAIDKMKIYIIDAI